MGQYEVGIELRSPERPPIETASATTSLDNAGSTSVAIVAALVAVVVTWGMVVGAGWAFKTVTDWAADHYERERQQMGYGLTQPDGGYDLFEDEDFMDLIREYEESRDASRPSFSA